MSNPTSPLNKPLPTLRTLEDAGKGRDIDKVVDLGALYELTIDISRDEHIERMGVFHPSSVDRCKRAEVLSFLRTPPSDRIQKKTKEIFEHGHVIHEVIQSHLEMLPEQAEAAGLEVEFEREVGFDPETDTLYKELGIGGTSDGVLRIADWRFEQRGTVEIKSQNKEWYDKLADRRMAWPNHLKQAHIYAYRHNTPIIWVFYRNKDNAKRSIKTHFFDWSIFDSAIMYFAECREFVQRGELPPRDETWLGCRDCVYRTLCKPKILQSRSVKLVPAKKLRRR